LGQVSQSTVPPQPSKPVPQMMPVHGLAVGMQQVLLARQTFPPPQSASTRHSTHRPALQTPLNPPAVQRTPLVRAGCVHVPAVLQTSLVQGLLSVAQAVPPPALGWAHPVAGAHESTVQGLLSLQFTGAPLAQAPFWQLSPVVHMLPSLHGVPAVLTGFEQMPVAGAHVPAL
jgi:hypothetical protein